jgi:cytochrome c553
MNHFISRAAIALTTVIAFASQAGAQGTAGTAPNASNAPSSAATCAGCHGAKGEGNAASNFPRLAGQPQAYLAHQLRSYADGSRNNSVMGPIAKGLSPQQIDEVAAYFAAMEAPASKPAAKQVQVSKRGQQLATIGDEKIAVQGCANCHGPMGSGEPPSYPYLAGQVEGYLKSALAEWKDGSRKTDPSLQMPMIAKRLSDSDITALAAYYAAQTPPPPATQRQQLPERPSGNAAPSGGASQAGKSVGVEQGEPTTGGSQGPGGGGATGSNSLGGSRGKP